jgi:quinol monooxygenase YgiN
MSEVNLLVRIAVKEEHTDAIKVEMCKAQKVTQQEEGCLRYQFYQDRETPQMFYVQECYANKDAFLNHANSEHMAEYLVATKGMVESVNMHKVDAI